MRFGFGKFFLGTAMAFVVVSAEAKEPSAAELLARIEELTQRIQQLEQERLQSSSGRGGSSRGAPAGEPISGELEQLTSDSTSRDNGTDLATSPARTVEGARSRVPGSSFVRNVISNTTVGGYASSEFKDFRGSDSTFDPHRFILNVGTQLHPRLHFYSEIEYEHGTKIEAEGEAQGTISITDTDGDGVVSAEEASEIDVELDTRNGHQGEIAVEQAWLQYDFNSSLGLRTGVILVPFGRFNLYHDDDLNNLTDRPLVARRVIPSTWSDAGVGFVWNFAVGEEAVVKGEVYLTNGLNDDISTSGGALREARANLERDNNDNKALVGRVSFSPALGQEVALSGYTGTYDDDQNSISGGAVDWDLRALGFQLLGEAAFFSLEDGEVASGGLAPSRIAGLYAELNYPFWFEFLSDTFLGRSFDDPKLIPTFRYNLAEIDRRGGAETLDEEGFVLGLAYRPVPSFVMKTEWQWNEGELERRNADGFIASAAIGF